MAYTFSHSITCSVSVNHAWQFWSDVDNWAALDPAVESVSLDGPFIAGTNGKTETGGSVGHWKLIEVQAGRGAVIEIPLAAVVLRFHWVFEELASGVQITQRVVLEGERAGDYLEGMKKFEEGIPSGMRNLADAMVRSATV